MASLILDGRVCLPKRLLDLGFQFSFPSIDEALGEVF
jgi:NAD dependent epimerase/dehydratase family enzyme